jgi:hypothetical protein
MSNGEGSHGKVQSLPTMGKIFLTMRLKGNTDLTIGCTHYNFSCHCLHLFLPVFLCIHLHLRLPVFLCIHLHLFLLASAASSCLSPHHIMTVGEQTPELSSSENKRRICDPRRKFSLLNHFFFHSGHGHIVGEPPPVSSGRLLRLLLLIFLESLAICPFPLAPNQTEMGRIVHSMSITLIASMVKWDSVKQS